MKTLAASPFHRRLWLQAQLDPADSAYSAVFVHRIKGLLDVDVLERAFAALVAHHEILRARWHDHPDELRVSIAETEVFELVRQRVDPEEFEEVSETFVTRLRSAPFDLSRGPLLRAGVLSAGPEDALLVTQIHHIAADDASLHRLFSQLAHAYDAIGQGRSLPLWPASVLSAHSHEVPSDAAREYWSAYTQDVPLTTALPSLPQGIGSLAASHRYRLNEELALRVREHAERTNASLFEFIAAAWAACVHRLSWEPRVAFAYSIDLREPSEGLGAHAALLPMALDVAGCSFSQLLERVRADRRHAECHERFPWVEIVRIVRRGRALSGDTPFLNLGVAERRLSPPPLHLDGLSVRSQEPPPARAIGDLQLEFDASDGITLRLIGPDKRFPRWLLEALGEAFNVLLEALCTQPDLPLSDHDLVDQTQRLRLKAHSQGRDLEVEVQGTLAERFAHIASATPDAVAVQTGPDGMTYWALDVRSNRTAHALVAKLGGIPDVGNRVALLFDRSAEALVAMLALSKLGLAYVPLRPSDPASDWAAQLVAADAIAVMGHGRYLEKLPDSLGLPTFSPDTPGSLSGQPDSPIASRACSETAACVFFASRAEDAWNRFVIPQRAILAVACGGGAHALGAEDVVVHGASLAYELATWEIWGALLNGARLVVLSKVELRDAARLSKHIDAHQISALALPTALFHAHADTRPDSFAGLRLLLVSGEVLEPRALTRVLEASEPVPERIVNAYGPRASLRLATLARVQSGQPGTAIPIGRPLSGGVCHVLDPEGRLAPVGFPGELWVGGAGLARYEGAEGGSSFVPAPEHLGASTALLYRTGDVGRWRRDGQLEILGSLASQGRPEMPFEVADHLMRHPDVRQAVFVSSSEGDAGEVLAYTLDPRSSLDDIGLREYLAERLPPQAIPARRIRLAALPLDDDAQLDVAALLALAPQKALESRRPLEPETETERRLLSLARDLVPMGELGVSDRLFELGVDSLIAARLCVAIQDAFGEGLRVSDLYRLATVRALATSLDGDVQDASEHPGEGASVPQVARATRLPLTLAQRGPWSALRRGSNPNTSCVLHLQTRIDPEAFLEAWDDVLARHELPWMQLNLEQPDMRCVDTRMANVIRMDLTRLAPDAAEYQVFSRVRRTLEEPFFNRAPMLAAILAQADHASWYFAFLGPQALVDACSLRLFARELHDTYLARLDGRALSVPQPMPLADYVDVSALAPSSAEIEAGVAHEKARLNGDANWRVPQGMLISESRRTEVDLDRWAIERLRALDHPLELTLTYCLLVTQHALFDQTLVRCIVHHHCRDQDGLAALPIQMSRALVHQSNLERAEPFEAGLKRFVAHHQEAMAQVRLPHEVQRAMRWQLFVRGRVGTSGLSRLIGTLGAMLSASLRVLVIHRVDATINAMRVALGRRLRRLFGRGHVGVEGCEVVFQNNLSGYQPLGSSRLPIRELMTPVGLPEGPSAPLSLALCAREEGVTAAFQGPYRAAGLEAMARAYQVLVSQVATSPEETLGARVALLEPHKEAFEGCVSSDE